MSIRVFGEKSSPAVHPQHFECLSGRQVHLPHWHCRFCQGSFDVISQDVVFWGKAMKRNILPPAITSTKEICFQKKNVIASSVSFFSNYAYAACNAKVTTKLQPSPLHDLYCISLSWHKKKTMIKNIITTTYQLPQTFPLLGLGHRKGLPQLLQLLPVEAVTREDTRGLRRGTVQGPVPRRVGVHRDHQRSNTQAQGEIQGNAAGAI